MMGTIIPGTVAIELQIPIMTPAYLVGRHDGTRRQANYNKDIIIKGNILWKKTIIKIS